MEAAKITDRFIIVSSFDRERASLQAYPWIKRKFPMSLKRKRAGAAVFGWAD
jgi:hypothetical protein